VVAGKKSNLSTKVERNRVHLLSTGTLVLFGCDAKVEYRNVTERNSNLLKRRYKIVGEIVAYGYRKHSQAAIEEIVLMPRPGIQGRQIVNLGTIPIGSVFSIKSVWLSNVFPDSNESLVVIFENYKFSLDAPVRVELFRGNEGPGSFGLNSKYYELL
jgi:hypothetical protein